MLGRDEAVPLRRALNPAVEIALLHLDDAVTALADEVVVVRLAAEPVALLVDVMGEDVDDPGVGQKRQGAINGREPRRGVSPPEPAPELLRRDVVGLASQLVQDLDPPRRGAHAMAF